MNRTILAISDFDSSGGSGVAADLKTFQTFRVYGAAAITAIIAQNTAQIMAIHPVPVEIVGQQIEAIVSDMPVHGVKVGMLTTADNVQIVASLVETFELGSYLVVDPILKSGSGIDLLDERGVALLKEKLIPQCFCITPNSMEASALTGVEVNDRTTAKEAAKLLHEMGARNVIITGGHFEGPHAIDLWFDGKNYNAFQALKVPSNNTHGIGCTFSSIICALSAKGMLMGECIDRAKKYIAKAVQHPFQIGKGKGPLNHTLPM